MSLTFLEDASSIVDKSASSTSTSAVILFLGSAFHASILAVAPSKPSAKRSGIFNAASRSVSVREVRKLYCSEPSSTLNLFLAFSRRLSISSKPSLIFSLSESSPIACAIISIYLSTLDLISPTDISFVSIVNKSIIAF